MLNLSEEKNFILQYTSSKHYIPTTTTTAILSTARHSQNRRNKGRILKQLSEFYAREDLGFGCCYVIPTDGRSCDDNDDEETKHNNNISGTITGGRGLVIFQCVRSVPSGYDRVGLRLASFCSIMKLDVVLSALSSATVDDNNMVDDDADHGTT
jgi:hypothetical protein